MFPLQSKWRFCQADATSAMAIEFAREEQVKGKDLIGELLKSLCGTRKAAHKWEKVATSDRRQWFCHRYMVTSIVCCRERELCGFVHGDDVIITVDSMQLTWAESRHNMATTRRHDYESVDDFGVSFWISKQIGAIEKSCLHRVSERCECEVSDNSSCEGAIVDTSCAHKA